MLRWSFYGPGWNQHKQAPAACTVHHSTTLIAGVSGSSRSARLHSFGVEGIDLLPISLDGLGLQGALGFPPGSQFHLRW